VLLDILNPDCSARALAQVSWVIPPHAYSDHGGQNTGYGPYWGGDIINAVGTSPCSYWNNTAIIITWDDWGGFYDHVPAPQPFRNQYELGFRVPLLAGWPTFTFSVKVGATRPAPQLFLMVRINKWRVSKIKITSAGRMSPHLYKERKGGPASLGRLGRVL